MSDPEALVKKAHKKYLLRPKNAVWTWMTQWWQGGIDIVLDDTIELLKAAAIGFKNQKQWSRAAEIYIECAQCYLKQYEINKALLGHLIEAADMHIAAADMFLKNNQTAAYVLHLQTGAKFFEQGDCYNRAANVFLQLGNHYTASDYTAAAVFLTEAIRVADLDNFEPMQRKALVALADLKIQQGHYLEAYQHYSRLIQLFKEHITGHWQVNKYCFKSILCLLCVNDVVGAEAKAQLYCDQLAKFQTSQEYQHVQDILQAMTDLDENVFQTVVSRCTDKEMTTLFPVIKTHLLLDQLC